MQRLLRFLLWMRADAEGGRKKGAPEIGAGGGLSLGDYYFRGGWRQIKERGLCAGRTYHLMEYKYTRGEDDGAQHTAKLMETPA